MSKVPAHEQIIAVRAGLGMTLAQFAAAIGCSSKGRVSEMENGKSAPTVAQALAIERLGGGIADAGDLNPDVAAARNPRPDPEQRTHDATSAIDDCAPVASGWELSEAELDAIPGAKRVNGGAANGGRVIICDVCERRVDGEIPNACTFVDCPHSERRVGSHVRRGRFAPLCQPRRAHIRLRSSCAQGALIGRTAPWK